MECLDKEILIFIWRENSFALLALRLLSPHLLISVFGFLFAYLYGWDGMEWMDGMDGMDGRPKAELERT